MNKFCTALSGIALFILSLPSLQAQKPIVLDKASHKVRATQAGYYAFPMNDYQLNAGSNFEWNLAEGISISSSDATIDNSYIATSNTNYPNALSNPNLFDVIAAGRGYAWDSFSQQSEAGFAEIGGDRTLSETFYIGDLSGGAKDSLSIPAQVIAYSAPRLVVAYPATAQSAWVSNYRKVANFTLTLAAFGLQKAPLSKVSNYMYSDTIVAWGKITVPMKDGGVSKPYEVLVSKRKVIRQDSMYLNGQPAPAQLMAAFGLSQGSVIMNHNYYAWRSDAPNYLINMSYGSDASYSLQPTLFISNLVEAGSTTSIDAEMMEQSAIAPNPASDNVTIALHKNNDAPWTVEIYSVVGNLVERTMISAGYGDVNVALSVSHLQTGSYNYIVRDENNRVISTNRFVVAR